MGAVRLLQPDAGVVEAKGTHAYAPHTLGIVIRAEDEVRECWGKRRLGYSIETYRSCDRGSRSLDGAGRVQ